MAIFPGAIVKLIPKYNQIRMVAYNRVNCHVAVSEAKSLFGVFSGGSNGSHFYVRTDGQYEQYIDTMYQSKADLNGNSTTISIETQGGVNDPQGEPWTPAQLKTIAFIYEHARKIHGIKNKMATSSKAGAESQGLSYHRLGVPGYMDVAGIKYSKSSGKICPGNKKISQIPEIFRLSQSNDGGFLMALTDAQQLRILQAAETIQRSLDAQELSRVKDSTVKLWLSDAVRNTDAAAWRTEQAANRIEAAVNRIENVVGKIWSLLTTPLRSGVKDSTAMLTPSQLWVNSDAYPYITMQQVAGLQATVETLSTALAQNNNSIDAEDLKATIQQAIAEAVVKVDVSVNTEK